MNLNQSVILAVAAGALGAYLRWGAQNNSQEEKMIASFFDLLKSKGLVKAILLIAIACVFGVTITPAVRLASAATPSLPTIFGMSLSDFLTWVVSSGVIGVVIAAALAKMSFIPVKIAEWLVPILAATFGAAVTAAVPFIAPDLLGKTVFEIVLMLVSGIVTWLFTLFGTHTIATLDDYKLRDRANKIVGAAAVVLALAFVLTLFTSATASAETYDQMVNRMFTAKQTAHPEIWNACDAKCVGDIQSGNNWWLQPLLVKVNGKFPAYAKPITLDDLTRYAIVRANEIAITASEDCKKGLIRDLAPVWPTDKQFSKCVITQDWWVTQYANNVEQTRADFDVSPMVFAVNRWPPAWRANREFGGPY